MTILLQAFLIGFGNDLQACSGSPDLKLLRTSLAGTIINTVQYSAVVQCSTALVVL
jgi:hypothetical protein